MTAEIHEALSTERLLTGVPGFDAVLGGGLIRGATYLVMGRPGAGKTTLGNQLCHAHVRRGSRAAYVTLLAESHANLVKNLQSMSFFDPAVVNRELAYVGAYRVLRDDKLRGLLELLRRVIEDERATLLVLDGIAPTRTIAGSDLALKEFIVELQVLAAMTDCTTLLLTNMTGEDAREPEHTMVDGLIELGFERWKRRTVRTLEVLKFRGSAHLLGRHELNIDSSGMSVHPSIEELFSRGPAPRASTARVETGLPALDEALGGGLLSGTTTVLLGFTGSGKTTLGLQFLEAGAERGEPGLYFGFYESPERLIAHASGVGLNLGTHYEQERIGCVWQGCHEYELDGIAWRLFRALDRYKARRLVIDGLDALSHAAVDSERMLRYLTALTNELRARDVTVLITDETSKARGPDTEIRLEGVSALAENLILLEYLLVGSTLRRLLSVIKQRSGPQAEVREFTIGRKGIALAPNGRSAAELLAVPDVSSNRRGATPRREP